MLPTMTAEEIARRGEETYARLVRPRVDPAEKGRIVVLDIESGDYVVDDDHLRATRLALERNPNAILYSVRVGYPTLGKFGGGWAETVK